MRKGQKPPLACWPQPCPLSDQGPVLPGAFGGVWWSARLCPQLLSSNVVNDLMLLESLLYNLMAQQKDTSARVRRLVLHGLANITLGSPDKVTIRQPSGALLLGEGGTAEPQLVRRPGQTQQPQDRRWCSEGGQLGMAWPGHTGMCGLSRYGPTAPSS